MTWLVERSKYRWNYPDKPQIQLISYVEGDSDIRGKNVMYSFTPTNELVGYRFNSSLNFENFQYLGKIAKVL